jgi:Acetyltransferase (GNAT) domain
LSLLHRNAFVHLLQLRTLNRGKNLIDTTAMQQMDSLSEMENVVPSLPQDARSLLEPQAAPVRVRVLTSDEEIDAIRDVWKKQCNHPHADPDFFKLVVRTSPEIKSSYVLVAERGSEITALLIGRVEEMRLDVRLGYAKLPRPRTQALVFIHGGLIGSPSSEECAALADAIAAALKNGTADVAFFNHLRTDSPLYSMLVKNPGFLTRDRFPETAVHRSITIPAGTDALWKQFPYKARGKFRWNMKTFLNAHADHYAIECFTKPSELEEMIRRVEVVAATTYQRSLGVGFGTTEADLARLRFKAEKGWLQAYILSIDNEPAAFFCGTLYRGIFFGDYMGFNPEMRRTSPGIFLTLSVVEKFCELTDDARVSAIDFGLGDARYKAELCNSSWEDGSFYLFSPTIKGAALNAYRTPILIIDRLARRIFNQQLQEKIKSKWRGMRRSKKNDDQTK